MERRGQSARLAACVVGALATGCVGAPGEANDPQPRERVLSDSERAQAAYLVGLEREVADDFHGAIRHYRRALSFNPRRADAHYRAGICYFSLGDYVREIAEYRKSVALNGQDAAVWRSLGEAYQSADDLNGAREAFGRSLQLEENAMVFLCLARIESDLGEVEVARGLYRKCMELSMDRRVRAEAEHRLQELEQRKASAE